MILGSNLPAALGRVRMAASSGHTQPGTPTQACLEYKGKFQPHPEAELKLQSQSFIFGGGAFCSTLVSLARNLWKAGSRCHPELVYMT